MKPAYFVGLFQCLTATFLLSQSNSVPLINQTAGVVSPTSSSQADPKAQARILDQYVKLPPRFQTTGSQAGLNFANAVAYDSDGQYAYSVAVADVNGDGKPDLIVTNVCASFSNCNNGTVSVLLGNGDGTFQTAVTYGSGGYDTHSVAVADVNGDGKPDLLLANEFVSSSSGANGTVGVLLGNGDGTFQTAVTYDSGGQYAYSVAVTDVNGDGKPDLIVTNNISNSVGVLLGNGDGSFQTAVTYDSGGSEVFSLVAADVNGDGKPDLVVANLCATVSNCANGTVGVLLGNGDGTFQTAVTYDSGGYASYSAAVADVNGDGKPDLIVTNEFVSSSSGANGTVGVLLGNGDGSFQTAVTYDSGGLVAYSVAVADVNGDGKPDLLVPNVSVLLGNGDGTFQTAVTYGSGGDHPSWLVVADVDGDGKPDLLVANQCASNSNSDCSNTGGTVGVLINTSMTATTTALVSSLNSSSFGQAVTFTATVTAQQGFYKGPPTGTVTFYDGTARLGTGTLNGSGIAAYTTSSLTVGQHSMTAVYSGDTNNTGSTSSVLTQTVNAADFSLSFSPSSVTVAAGQSGTSTLTVTPQGSFTSSISFSCSGLPPLAGCTFKPASVTPNSGAVTSTLTITTTAQTAYIVSPFGRRSRPLYAMWLVLPAMLLGTVGLAAPKRRKLLSYCVVLLLVSGCLLQLACGGTNNGGNDGGGGGGTGGTPAGNYTVTVTGAAGATQQTTGVTLIVQ